ncbi:RloB family protein [Flavobacterium sp.]|uniref:RloB family protein n=1 Tax=Flavobacterium sp. TaxID=239 RepID=UPI002FDA5DB3
MPREREDIFLESNSKIKEKVIVLAFEGNDTERIYFDELKSHVKFNDDVIYLHLLSRPKNDTNSAPIHVFNKLKKEAKEEYNFNSQDELWMIIDKDKWKNIESIVELCKAQGNMFVAVSNPCFELWLLLHIKEISELSEVEIKAILNNKKVSKNRTYIDKFLSDLLSDGYNKSNPIPSRFLPTIYDAIRQAKALDNLSEDFPSSIGSHVYKIAEIVIK